MHLLTLRAEYPSLSLFRVGFVYNKFRPVPPLDPVRLTPYSGPCTARDGIEVFRLSTLSGPRQIRLEYVALRDSKNHDALYDLGKNRIKQSPSFQVQLQFQSCLHLLVIFPRLHHSHKSTSILIYSGPLSNNDQSVSISISRTAIQMQQSVNKEVFSWKSPYPTLNSCHEIAPQSGMNVNFVLRCC